MGGKCLRCQGQVKPGYNYCQTCTEWWQEYSRNRPRKPTTYYKWDSKKMVVKHRG